MAAAIAIFASKTIQEGSMIEKNCLENSVGVTKSVTCSGKLFSKHGGSKRSLSVGREAGIDFGKIWKDCKITPT